MCDKGYFDKAYKAADDKIEVMGNELNIHMGDSREVPHVNIVRKLRHSCEDVIFASSIYSNTLKHFKFIVDYCLSLHIMYKHSQTRSEHFLYKPITNDVHSRFFCSRLFDDVIYAQSNRTQDAVFKRYVLHSM